MSAKSKLFTLSAIAATLLSTSAMAKINAQVEIENANSLTGNKDVVAKLTFTNTEDQPVRILNYLMKANKNGELEEDLFTITRDGKPVGYEGMHVKRPAPKAIDYLTLRPGASKTFKIELSADYDLTQAGNYTIQYNASHLNMFSHQPMVNAKAATMGMDGVESNEASVFIAAGKFDYVNVNNAKRCNPKKENCDGGGDPDPGTGGVTFTGACSSGEQSDLIEALGAAKDMANDSIASLGGNTGARYTTWFGDYSSTRHNTVSSNFDAIKDAMDNKPLTFDCSCNQSYFAYVYPNQPYKVYFCRAFWNANVTGTDSRGGTIIHEISHFNAVAGTDDIVYGQSGAKSLAISNPNDAVKNADSHEYFAENTPHQN
jgi:peptidyl-Lys metalloendopeptidase